MQIPVVDISACASDDALAAELGRGYEDFGFCGIVGHAVDAAVIDDAYRATRALFALPPAVKQRYAAGSGGARGYTGVGIETARDSEHPDLKEFWQVGREVGSGAPVHPSLLPNVWPDEAADFRRSVYRLFEALDTLGARILDAIALHLNLPGHYFRDKVNAGNSVLRATHYPPIERRDTLSVRAGAHEDINLLTLLVGSDEPGLEILTRSGRWLPVSHPRGTIVANIGDMLQRLTNHVLRSTTHRVVNTRAAYRGVSRFSIPFFLHPNPDFLIDTLPGCVSDSNPNRYPEAITADAYLTERLIEIGLLDAE